MFQEPLRDHPTPSPEIKKSPATIHRKAPTPARRREANLDRLFLHRRGELSWDQMTGFRDGRRRKAHTVIFLSWLALAIDGLILISMSSFFLLALAFVARSSMHGAATPMFGAAFVATTWVYLIVSRILYGYSLGEWACDLRLGQPTQRFGKDYPLKVILRASLILLSGIVTLPLLSILTGSDVAGRISGLKIVSLK